MNSIAKFKINLFSLRALKILLSAADKGHSKAIEDVVYPLIVRFLLLFFHNI